MNPTPNWFVTLTTTTDNVVTPLIDGMAALGEIQAQISALTAQDFCLYGAWIMFADSTTLPGATQNLRDEFIAAINRGADIRILLYAGMPDSAYALGGHVENHLRVKDDIGAAGGQVVIDTHHPVIGSHHDKYAIFGKKLANGEYQLTAFCGGIDPVFDRVDGPDHTFPNVLGIYQGWHDAHSKVEGPAATYIWYDFVNRWNENLNSLSYLRTAVTRIDTSLYTISATLPTEPTHHVEILNTYSCSKTRGYSFVPNAGIETIKEAYLNAIANAQHYIYIESPFFADESISTALRQKLIQTPSVYVIVMTNLYGGNEGYYSEQNFNIIRQALAALTQFYPCHPVASTRIPIYCHAKLMIVDDVYYTLGSANITPRSMTMDTEINIGVLGDDIISYDHDGVTYDVRQSARDLRVALWAEHLQLTDNSSLLEIPTAIATWIANIEVAPSRVQNCNPSVPSPNGYAEGGWYAFQYSYEHPTDHCI